MILETTQRDAVRYWTLTRPERGNGLGVTMAAALDGALIDLQQSFAAWQQAGQHPDRMPCRVLVIAAVLGGKNRNIWIAGGDLVELAELEEGSDGLAYSEGLSRLLSGLESLPIPVIAAIGGAAIGGGAEFALAADLRFGSELCSFEFRQLQIGLTTGYGSCRRLVTKIGLSAAQDLLFRSKKIVGTDLIRYGLIHELVATGEELATLVDKTAADLCKLNPMALLQQKRMLTTAAELINEENRLAECQVMKSLWMNDFHKRAVHEFVATRTGPK